MPQKYKMKPCKNTNLRYSIVSKEIENEIFTPYC